MKILCFEIDKNTGRKAYYIVSHSVEGSDLFCLKLRNRSNEDLKYYCTILDKEKTDEEIISLFKQKKYRKEPYFAYIS